MEIRSEHVAGVASSYGAMTTILSYLKDKEHTVMQQLSVWWYHVNLPRIQIKITVAAMKTFGNVYFI